MNTCVQLDPYFRTYLKKLLDTYTGPCLDELPEGSPHHLFAQALEQLQKREHQPGTLELLSEAAEHGHAHAAYCIGILLVLVSQGEDLDLLNEAETWLEYAADLGLEEAMIALGFFYLAEDCPLRNDGQSAQAFRRVAEAGNVEGFYEYGCCLLSGRGVEQDFVQAAEWLQRGADADDTLSQFELGVQYSLGEGVEKDDSIAISLFEKAAAKGHPGSMAAMADYYYEGEGVEQDFAQAFQLYYQCYQHGNPKGNIGLSRFFLDGEIVAIDVQTALQLLSEGAAANHPIAMHHKRAILDDIEQDIQKGDVVALTALGWAILQGTAYEGDKQKAYECISTAAAKGDPLARCLLRCYFSEKEDPNANSTEECAQFFRELSDEGCAWAARELFFMAAREEIQATADESFEMLTRAIELGDWVCRELALDKLQKTDDTQNSSAS